MKKSATKTFGILTSGGDCPGLNAAIRGVAKAAYGIFDMKIIGINMPLASIRHMLKPVT